MYKGLIDKRGCMAIMFISIIIQLIIWNTNLYISLPSKWYLKRLKNCRIHVNCSRYTRWRVTIKHFLIKRSPSFPWTKLTYISSCPFMTRLGPVPVRLPIPPTFAEYAILNVIHLHKRLNAGSSSSFKTLSLKGIANMFHYDINVHPVRYANPRILLTMQNIAVKLGGHLHVHRYPTPTLPSY